MASLRRSLGSQTFLEMDPKYTADTTCKLFCLLQKCLEKDCGKLVPYRSVLWVCNAMYQALPDQQILTTSRIEVVLGRRIAPPETGMEDVWEGGIWIAWTENRTDVGLASEERLTTYLPPSSDHITELRNTRPTAPFFFLKPPSSLLSPSSGPLLLPRGVHAHHEVELGLLISRRLTNLPASDASAAYSAIGGYCIAIDMTARNVQDQAKKKGLPWTIAKGFDTFCPVSEVIPKEVFTRAGIEGKGGEGGEEVVLKLSVNGEVRQRDGTGLMLWGVPRILSDISRVMTLEEGDLVLTGTPKGVGRVVEGDWIEAGVEVGGRDVEEGRIKVEVKGREEGGFVFEGE
ncbi:MAG: hypothetical protein Q9227_002515 [Pyrenula ochraceoflavens]